MKKYNFAVVGATGLVGRTFLKVMEEYALPMASLRLFASERSVGKSLPFAGKNYPIEALKEGAFKAVDFALFSAGSEVSRLWGPIARDEGAIVIDNSSCWRMDEACALIVPEVNLADYKTHSRLIANPNCSTIQSVLPLKPLDDAFHLTRILFSTYQAVSGSGKKGLDDYERCERGEAPQFYPYDIAKTCIPEIDAFLDNGYSKEEMKMVNETRKILHRPGLAIAATCVRVPVPLAHGVSIAAEFAQPVSVDAARAVLQNYPGVRLVDDPKKHIYPVSMLAAGNDFVYVGRIRKDLSSPNGLLLYTVGDNVRKGAASNAVQIACKIIEEKEKENA